ncbi:MAG: hypothetical protein ACFB16_15010 [Phormidesmis sp.]
MRNFPWFSILLLLLANIAFGLFLRDLDLSGWVWTAAIAYIAFECSILSIFWTPFYRFIMIGFNSDVGYSLTALLAASLAVVIVAWVNITSYFLVMLAAALLVRVDLFTRRIGTLLSFILLLAVSWLGLTISWLMPGLHIS